MAKMNRIIQNIDGEYNQLPVHLIVQHTYRGSSYASCNMKKNEVYLLTKNRI
jgi:hypothetical protein